MAVFAIADLHLSFNTDKPMDVFGGRWNGYTEKLRQQWQQLVAPEDTVILPGDISWSTYLEECLPDFSFLQSLNGQKILLKGNHDYWWTTVSKLKAYIAQRGLTTISFLHNNAILVEDRAICGSRGWITPKTEGAAPEDIKIYLRELARIRLSLEYAQKNFPDAERIVFVHYPPFNGKKELDVNFVELMEAFSVTRVIYGHLHAEAHKYAVNETVDGIAYQLVSADFINFMPQHLY